MATHHVHFVGFDHEPALLDPWRGGILAAWPGGPTPTAEQVSMEQALVLLDGSAMDACVLLLASERIGSAAYQLLDLLDEQRVPTIILTRDRRALNNHLTPGQALVCELDEAAASVAIRLDTLLRRQITVDRCAEELRIARRCQTGLESEVSRIHDEMQLASMIQREFLPRSLPELDDVRFGVFYRPAGYVSGDMYDVRRLDEHTIGFFLADAVGHGVPAALLTMVISRCLTLKVVSDVDYRIVSPGEVLARLNEEMLRLQSAGGRFATAVYGIIDTRSHKVTIAGAGHPPPRLIKEDGASIGLETDGGLLGVFADATFSETSLTLRPGERLVLFTDGFETAFPEAGAARRQRRLPTDRYLDCMARICGGNRSVDESVAELGVLVDDQSGSLHQIDDLTAIIVQSDAPAAVQAPHRVKRTRAKAGVDADLAA
ncbi:MAG: SpoIIE family protein phosphatase [Phycisphaerales bacterium]|nr:SpoIIE family protein phosphatase [Phycisphaerales bacterium]